MNFLSSYRSFLDHWNKKLEDLLTSRGVDHITAFKLKLKWSYDNFFAYKLLYYLRNYTQHYALPVQGFHIRTYSDGPKTRLYIGIAIHTLLASGFDWKADLRQEMVQQPPIIDIIPLLEQLMFCIADINQLLTDQDFIIISKHYTTLVEKYNEVQNVAPNSLPVIINDTTKTPFNFTIFPTNAMKKIQTMLGGIDR